jgi:hypothetical protein
MMKKKTVITTEKLEVWIIPQPEGHAGDDQPASDADRSEPNNDFVPAPNAQAEEET